MKNRDSIFVGKNHKTEHYRILIKDVLFLEAQGDYIIVYMKKRVTHRLHKTLLAMQEEIKHLKQFIKIHRTYVVNIVNIDYIEDNTVHLEEYKVPISEGQKKEFLNHLITI